jgi:Ca-activated chloride channel family protein
MLSRRGEIPFTQTGFSRRTAFLLAFLLAVVACGVPALRAQDRPPRRPDLKKPPTPEAASPQTSSNQQNDTITIESNLVVLDVSVFDKENRLVGDLKAENFRIFEDQIQQNIETFSREEAPVSLGFVIDTSGSMRPKLPKVVEAVKLMTKSAKKGDEFFVVDFKNKAELVEEFTPRVADVEDAVDNLIAGSGTALLDAIAVSAEYASKEGKNRRKAIVVMSDGDERDSFYKRKEIVKLMQEYDVQVYIVGFSDELDNESGIFKRSTRKKAMDLIMDIAGESGGRAFFPQSLNEVTDIAKQINSDLRTQYAIGYAPTNEKNDGTFRKVTIRVEDGKRKLVARTRTGYTAQRVATK